MDNLVTTKIIVVDDDVEILELVSALLKQSNYEVRIANSVDQAYLLLNSISFDLAILDINLSGEDGIVLCQNIRKEFDFPIIMLTASHDKTDLLLSLNMGADYYLTKPFDIKVLLGYIKVALRRSYLKTSELAKTDFIKKKPIYKFNNWVLDTNVRSLSDQSGVKIILTAKEYQLLLAFLSNSNRVLSREYLSDLINGKEFTPFDRSIDVLISKVRKKINCKAQEDPLIHTLRGAGYLFSCYVDVGS